MARCTSKEKSKITFKDYVSFRKLLLDNGIKTMSEFARFMGYRPSTVSLKFAGKCKWKLDDLIYMSEKFKVTLDELAKMLSKPC